MMDDYNSLRRVVAESPAADTPIAVLADWLDANGRPDEALAWRWLGVFRRRPGTLTLVTERIKEVEVFGWMRANEPMPLNFAMYASHFLPPGLFDALPRGPYPRLGSMMPARLYPSWAEAIDAMVSAFARATKPGKWRPLFPRIMAKPPAFAVDWSLAKFVPEFVGDPFLKMGRAFVGSNVLIDRSEYLEELAAGELLDRDDGDPRRTAGPTEGWI